MALNPRQRTFCAEYLIDFNATRAARAAGYSKETSGQIGHELLKNVEIAAEIQRLMEAQGQRLEMTADDVLREIVKIAKADRRNLVDENGRAKGLHELDDVTAAAVDGYKIGKEGVEIKMVKKLDALVKLAERYNLFSDHEKNKQPNVIINIGGKDERL